MNKKDYVNSLLKKVIELRSNSIRTPFGQQPELDLWYLYGAINAYTDVINLLEGELDEKKK